MTIPLSACPSGSSPRSFEFWIQTSQPDTDYIDVFQGSPDGGHAFDCYLNPGTGSILLTDEAVDNVGATALNDGNRHHVAITFDGTTLYIYVDGVLDF